ncbi:MAG: hypothetical protein PHY34_02140 [Patescibacteria group bacterium]|nr:hypothetical protein [Patescibacteria group bacterium]MDD5715267.1 hypothetical protein [Patescibacteria group bacterium]
MKKKLLTTGIIVAIASILTGCASTSTNSNSKAQIQNSNALANNVTSVSNELLGSWQTDCLVPDPDSPWAEQHFFTFNDDSTAEHRCVSYDQASCAGEATTLVDLYSYSFPTTGQIDLVDSDKGNYIKDIYQLSGNEVRFGHGFRNDTTSENKDSTDRITTLNAFIVYTKVE